MRLPWDKNQANPRKLSDDWLGHWSRNGAIGLAWDFARSTSDAPIQGTVLLAPCAGYVSSRYQELYGNFVDIQTESGWTVRLAHLADRSRVRTDLKGLWIPRGAPIGDLGNTGGPWPYHIHLELLWRGSAPPALEGGDRLPADSHPFGVPRDDLLFPGSEKPTNGNQTIYKPLLRVMEPLPGSAIRWDSRKQARETLTLLRLRALEWSELHEYRWLVWRVDTGEVMAESDWRRALTSGVHVAGDAAAWPGVGRGEYEWRTQARFPDLREGHEDEWLTSDELRGRFTILDVARIDDWLRWQLMRIIRPAHAAEEEELAAHESPPPVLPAPELPAGGLPCKTENAPLPQEPAPGTPPSAESPGSAGSTACTEAIATAQRLFDGIAAGDVGAASQVLHPKSRLSGQAVLALQKALFDRANVSMELNLMYECLDSQPDSATVRVAGLVTLRNRGNGSVVAETDSYYVDVPLVRSGGSWYVDADLSSLISELPSQ